MADLFPHVFTREQKREGIERELKKRRSVYPRQVADKKMSQAFADMQIALFEAIAKDYEGEGT